MRKTIRLAVVGLMMGTGLGLYVFLRPASTLPIRIGEDAPDFILPGLDGNPVSLANYRRRVVVLNFWATWCPPCVEETPSLEKFSVAARPLGVTVLGVSVDENPAAPRRFASNYHLSFPIARDPGGAVASRFGTFKFPETYIIDRSGKVAEKIIGPTDWQDPRMMRFVESLSGHGASSGE